MRKAVLLLVIGLLGTFGRVNAQGTVLPAYQDTLQKIAAQINATKDDEVKVAINAEFIKTLVSALKIPFSYNFPFDSLKNVSVVKAPDNAFRMITWYLPLNDGTYRYYGAIQMSSPDGKLKLFPLSDDTDGITDNNAITSNKNWFGARYYDIVPVTVPGKQPYYVMLGWKGKNQRLSSKVIEILSFDKGAPIFGKQVFDGMKVSPPRNRVVLEYSRFNTMTLQRDHAVNLIVFEHLIPLDSSRKDDPEYYASDSSFDAFKVLNGRLKLLENVELLNPPSATDEFYNDPKALKKAAANN